MERCCDDCMDIYERSFVKFRENGGEVCPLSTVSMMMSCRVDWEANNGTGVLSVFGHSKQRPLEPLKMNFKSISEENGDAHFLLPRQLDFHRQRMSNKGMLHHPQVRVTVVLEKPDGCSYRLNSAKHHYIEGFREDYSLAQSVSFDVVCRAAGNDDAAHRYFSLNWHCNRPGNWREDDPTTKFVGRQSAFRPTTNANLEVEYDDVVCFELAHLKEGLQSKNEPIVLDALMQLENILLETGRVVVTKPVDCCRTIIPFIMMPDTNASVKARLTILLVQFLIAIFESQTEVLSSIRALTKADRIGMGKQIDKLIKFSHGKEGVVLSSEFNRLQWAAQLAKGGLALLSNFENMTADSKECFALLLDNENIGSQIRLVSAITKLLKKYGHNSSSMCFIYSAAVIDLSNSAISTDEGGLFAHIQMLVKDALSVIGFFWPRTYSVLEMLCKCILSVKEDDSSDMQLKLLQLFFGAQSRQYIDGLTSSNSEDNAAWNNSTSTDPSTPGKLEGAKSFPTQSSVSVYGWKGFVDFVHFKSSSKAECWRIREAAMRMLYVCTSHYSSIIRQASVDLIKARKDEESNAELVFGFIEEANTLSKTVRIKIA